MTAKLQRSIRAAACALTLASSSCVGGVEQPARPTGGSPVLQPDLPPADSNSQSIVCADPVIAQQVRTGGLPMRRLTRTEYNFSVLDVLGLDGNPAADFALDDTVGPLLNNVASSVNALMAEQYRDAAETLAKRAADDLARLLPCDPKLAGEPACIKQFIAQTARRLYRRPLSNEELAGLNTLAGAEPIATRARVLLTAMLQAPSFLYRAQTGVPVADGSGAVALDDHEVATRLSYFLWASGPDDVLLDAADQHTLTAAAGIAAQVTRMMADAKFSRTVESFHTQWLGLDELLSITKDRKVYPEFTDTLRHALWTDVTSFVDEVVVRGDGKLSSLFSAPIAFVTPELAKLYNVSYPGKTDAAMRVELPREQRSGLLTTPAFLAVHANPNQGSPIKRGVAIRERVFCEGLPPPPADVPAPPAPRAGATTRERFATHTSVPECAACHRLIDPIGFGLENFDGLGRYRSQEDGRAIDSSGVLAGNNDAAGPFDGARELSQRIAESEAVRSCVTSVWLQYALGRDADECSRAAALQKFAASDYDVRALITAITQAESFRFGRPE